MWGKHLHTNATISASARCCIRGKHWFHLLPFQPYCIHTVTAPVRSVLHVRPGPLTSPNEVCQCDSSAGRLRVFALNQFWRSCGPHKWRWPKRGRRRLGVRRAASRMPCRSRRKSRGLWRCVMLPPQTECKQVKLLHYETAICSRAPKESYFSTIFIGMTGIMNLYHF